MNPKRKPQIIILALLVLSGIVVAIFLPFNSNLNDVGFYVTDENNNYHYETGEVLTFNINDPHLVEDRHLIWHLGNGDTLYRKENVQYTYKKEGQYLITLTDIEKKISASQYIKVISGKEYVAKDSIPKIHGVSEGYQGEELVFSAEGPGIDTWYWEFGETGTVDAYKQQIVYIYNTPGTYQVKLLTNTTEYPIYHTVNILPRFERIEETAAVDSLSLAAEDIKEKLQAIANTKVKDKHLYHKNVNYIKDTYLCDRVEEVVIVVNGSKFNDFYSYCQGLHFLEGAKKNRLKIEQVTIDRFKCIEIINVTQNTISNEE